MIKSLDIERLLVGKLDTAGDAAKIIRKEPEGIALILNDEEELVGTVTDPLLRMALLDGLNLNDPLVNCMHTSPDFEYLDRSEEQYIQIMEDHQIYQLPLLDRKSKVRGIAALTPKWKNNSDSNDHPIVVLMAGGLGMRMRPVTDYLPKPMIDVGGKPILERILHQFIDAGFQKFVISVNYMADVISDYFGSGERYGVDIQYLREKKRMGTAGSLGLLDIDDEQTVVVANGDVYCDLDLSALMTFHLRRQNNVTLAANRYSQQIPYGVISIDHQRITGIEEKPRINFLANSGVYAIEAACLRHLPPNEFFDMPSLINLVATQDGSVQAYALYEPWHDVGNPDDLERARALEAQNT